MRQLYSLIMLATIFNCYKGFGQSKKDSLKSKPVDTTVKSAIQLKEVNIKAKAIPLKMKGDTVSYNAGAFKTRANSSVQDLLKKMPGLQVDREGNITFNGRRIQKIYIDGKDYYLNDPKAITQNLTADMIDRIELFDQPSKESELSGVKDVLPGKAINLKLKEGVSLALTGKMHAGFGNRDGYSTGAIGSSFVKARALIAELGSNNINNFAGGNAGTLPANGRSSSHNGTLLYSDNWGKWIKTKMNYSGKHTRITNQNSVSNRQSLLADSVLLESRRNNTVAKASSHNFGGSWEITPDTASTLNVLANLLFGHINNANIDTLSTMISRLGGGDYPASAGSTTNIQSSITLNNMNGARYTRRFKKRTLSFNLDQRYSGSEQQGSLNSVLRFYASNGNLNSTQQTDQRYTQTDRKMDYTAEFTNNELLKAGHSLSIGYKYQQTKDKTAKQTSNYNAATGRYDLPDSLTSTNFSGSTARQQASFAYTNNAHKLNYKLGLSLEYNTLQGKDDYRATRFNRVFTGLMPSASLSYGDFSDRGIRQIIAEYSSRSHQPFASQLQAVTDNRNPLQLVTGNPDLKQQVVHSLTLNYFGNSVSTAQSFSLSLMSNFYLHSVVQATEILEGGIQRTSYVNMEGRYNLGTEAGYELPLNTDKQGKLKFSLASVYERIPGLLNGQENVQRAFNSEQKIELSHRFWDKLELNAEAGLALNVSRYSLGADMNSSGLIQNYKLGLNYELPFDMLLKSDGSLQRIGAQKDLAAQQMGIWNASLLKNVLKDGRGEIKVSAYDILNSNRGFYQQISAGSIRQTTSNVLGRLVLLSFVYHLRSVPGKEKSS